MSERSKNDRKDLEAFLQREDWRGLIDDIASPPDLSQVAPAALPAAVERALQESLGPERPRASWKLWGPILVVASGLAGVAPLAILHNDGPRDKGGEAPIDMPTLRCGGGDPMVAPFACAPGLRLDASMSIPNGVQYGTILAVTANHELVGDLAPKVKPSDDQLAGPRCETTLEMPPRTIWIAAFWSRQPFTDAALRAALTALIAKPGALGHAASLPALDGKLFWAEVRSEP